ncbi:hypothetical protein SISNIDRAFT_481855 [Sistotremastrum niveocremeum HHB9708]|uniref:Sjogrens syndrome scleroderma autoantigen 1 n=1 Tax=Sistotremastrum niveocremeum HHB9708 TaxID=1314777 RepID=A0A164ZRH4_9AGAM|nr:hypothetical protein SISNIDRAFT_481855 [Sistotremastrum niveocremeum HHB9708]
MSKELGVLMLQGWVLTDVACSNCPTPLMRSPKGRTPVVMRCVNCEANNAQITATADLDGSHRASSPGGNTSSDTHLSGRSTPPTEISSHLSSPTFAPVLVDTPEMIRRRAQSDRASALIASKMIEGWAMLADECPNPRCYGVPLIRPPSRVRDESPDPRKECVICGTVYISDKDSGQLKVAPGSSTTLPRDAPVPRLQVSVSEPETTPIAQISHKWNAPWARRQVEHRESSSQASSIYEVQEPLNPMPPQTAASLQTIPTDLPVDLPLFSSIGSLNKALGALTKRLDDLTAKVPLPHVEIGEVSQAIDYTATALSKVEELNRLRANRS